MSGTGLARFGITHLSASSINLWVAAPDVWVAKYLLKRQTPFGPAPMRGIAVEQAVSAMLHGESEEAAIKAAETSFDKRFLIGTEETTKERDLIAPMAKIAAEELRPFGRPDDTGGGQEKITITANFGDWSIPIIGFLDFSFSGHGLVADLKTVGRMPSKMSIEHIRQRSIYAKAKGNASVKFLYTGAKKATWLEDGDVAATLREIKAHVARIEAFLAACPDAETAAAIVPCNPSSFYWRGAEVMREEIFNV